MSELSPHDPELSSKPREENQQAPAVPLTSRLSAEQTLLHLSRNYDAAMRELAEEGIQADPQGLSLFSQAVVISDALTRSTASRIPWDVVLQQVFHEVHEMGQRLAATGNIAGATPANDIDD